MKVTIELPDDVARQAEMAGLDLAEVNKYASEGAAWAVSTAASARGTLVMRRYDVDVLAVANKQPVSAEEVRGVLASLATDPVEAETEAAGTLEDLRAMRQGIEDIDAGRTVSVEEASARADAALDAFIEQRRREKAATATAPRAAEAGA